ncbi:MAG: nicotinamide riboside transporter PnuC, partial [Flavobacteriaceae bacterium]|nr:nicotinamide riboside transporter PnuC [Flavobacteriaceae bacterium]
SVWFAHKENILVFPTGLVSTGIFVYILWVYGLLGDMLINGYYTAMSIYGWWFWWYKKSVRHEPQISRVSRNEWRKAGYLFIGAILFVVGVYMSFDMFHVWTAYVDTFTTAIFFVAMWLMAKKKWEHWHFWIVGNLISIPLYWYKGLTFTAFQYILFTIIAVLGYQSWKKNLSNSHQN